MFVFHHVAGCNVLHMMIHCSAENSFAHLQYQKVMFGMIQLYHWPPTWQASAMLLERQTLLWGPSVGHIGSTAEVKSSRFQADHSTLGCCLRCSVKLRMRVSYSRLVLVTNNSSSVDKCCAAKACTIRQYTDTNKGNVCMKTKPPTSRNPFL